MDHKDYFGSFAFKTGCLLFLTAVVTVIGIENRGRWTQVLDFPLTYENVEDDEGNKFFTCQGLELSPFDPLRYYWSQRCYDDSKSVTKRTKICNSTAICCYKYCLLQWLEWVDEHKRFNRDKAQKFIRREYGKRKYPPNIINGIVSEYEICAKWYDQHDREGCSNNGPFAKCNSQVLLNVCNRRGASNVTAVVKRSTEITSLDEIGPKAHELVRRSIPPRQVYEPPHDEGNTCVSKCKSLCLGKTKFE